jgi:hypothetical protein
MGGNLVFQAPNIGIWSYDGQAFTPIWEGISRNEKQLGDNLYVRLDTTNEAGSYIGNELWVTDGVTPPKLVIDLNTNPIAPDIRAVIENPFGGEDSGLILTGDVSDDVLVSSPFDDTMTGKGGSDRFVFIGIWGMDTITDFEDGGDVIDLSQTSLNYDDLLPHEQLGSDTVVSDGAGNTITLTGITATEITEDDFLFGG